MTLLKAPDEPLARPLPWPGAVPGSAVLACPQCGGPDLRVTTVSVASDPRRGPAAGLLVWPRTGRAFTSDEPPSRASEAAGPVLFLDYQCERSGCRGGIELHLGEGSTLLRLTAAER
ncbi:hypothetical protein [Actinocorallia longicatena]